MSEFDEGYENNLSMENKNGLIFFDKDRDEISFFHFNVSEIEFNFLRQQTRNRNDVISSFNRIFLKNKNLNWSSYKNRKIESYIKEIFDSQVEPSYFGNGVSMSHYVYPLILTQIDTIKYAEEYIILILSDFLTGSELGNKDDLNRVRDIYGIPYGTLPENSPVSFIKKEIDYLSSKFYKIDYFEFSFRSSPKDIAIIAYKIKPKVGRSTPEDISLFVDSDLELKQNSYEDPEFRINEINIKFNHNDNLVPMQLNLNVFSRNEDSEELLFKDIIATRDSSGTWSSDYTNGDDLMKFDSSKISYFIPSLNINLDSYVIKKDFQFLKFKYGFNTKYEIAEALPINFVYTTERILSKDDISFSTIPILRIMEIIIPIFAVLGLVFFLVHFGKPKSLILNLDGYQDSFEIIDYKTVGKLLTPYKAWKNEDRIDYLLVKGEVKFKSESSRLNWNPNIYIRLSNVNIPTGFEIFLKHNNKRDNREFSGNNKMIVKKKNKNDFEFLIGIRQVDINKKITNPGLAKFEVEAEINDFFISEKIIKSELQNSITYSFHIGEDLHDVWVGLDPGTTASCISVGTSSDNVILGENVGGKIIDSSLIFETMDNLGQFSPGDSIPSHLIKHGAIAYAKFGTKNVRSFQSIKKLLGFTDIQIIEFADGQSLKLTGKELARELVKRIYGDLENYILRIGVTSNEYKKNGLFSPQRAVVAIPNNFTITKIQDMVDCIRFNQQFKEIRYVYEAEAVLFYYLSNNKKLNEKVRDREQKKEEENNKKVLKKHLKINKIDEGLPNTETILVFDMGGATINATVISYSNLQSSDNTKYYIDILGKIGYGIGGDTIDYCLIKFIFSFTDEFPQFKGINIFDKKFELARLATIIKKEIVSNYENNKDFLITALNLQDYINNALGIQIEIEDTIDPDKMYSYFKKLKGRFKIFEHSLFNDIVYNNVKDATLEVVDLSDTDIIDKVIFSGRSTFFPKIKETVIKQLKARGIEAKTIELDQNESKTAVAIGACWYGVNKNAIIVNNFKTNASFGFKKKYGADETEVEFHELVGIGIPFETSNGMADSYEGIKEIKHDFALDGNKVNFFQIMGKNAQDILAENQMHKYSKVASIFVDLKTNQVAMKVTKNDDIECAVVLENNRPLKEKGVVSDQSIEDANAEHYTWIIKQS